MKNTFCWPRKKFSITQDSFSKVQRQRTRRSTTSQTCDQQGFGLFQSRDRFFPGHGGKALKESIQRLAAFEVIQQGLKGDPRSSENRLTAQDFSIF